MRRISKLNFTTAPIVRPRIIEVSDDVMLGSPREAYNPSSSRHSHCLNEKKRGPTSEEEEEEKEDDEGDVSVFSEFVKSRRQSTSVSPSSPLPVDHHTEHGLLRRRPLHQQRCLVKAVPGPSTFLKDSRGAHYHQHHHHHRSSAGAGVKVVQRVETKTSVLSDGSTRNKVWRQSAAVDGTWVVSEEEEYVTREGENESTSSFRNFLNDPQIWKGCKILASVMLVILLLVMAWLYGFYFVDFVKWSLVGGWSVVANGGGHLVSILQREQRMNPAHHDPVPERTDFGNSNPPGFFDEASIRSLQQAVLMLKIKLETVEQIVEKHESRLTSQDDHLKLLESEIRRTIAIIADTKEAFNNDKIVDHIIEQVLAIPLGETEEGDLVTLRSLFSVLEDKAERERIARKETEAKVGFVAERLVKVEEYFGGVDNSLFNLKTELKEIEAKVEGFGKLKHSGLIGDDKGQIEQVILPLIITEIEKQIKASSALKKNGDGDSVPFSGLTIKDVQWMITRTLAKYDADKTGLPDLALESAGGSILSVRNTKAPKLRNAVITSFWGFRLWAWAPPNTPRTIIQPGVVPGECWSFEGSTGNVVIKLAVPSIITGFSLEHIPKALSRHGHINSAPKKFQVLGLMDEKGTEQAHDFGEFTYEDNNEPLQYFSVLSMTSKSYPIVELKILSNQGNAMHTCVYRFRVHGAVDHEREMKTDSGSEDKSKE